MATVFNMTGSGGGAVVTQEKYVTITENGEVDVLPDEGKLLSAAHVTVDVSGGSADTQEKYVTITENGTVDVLPDAGKLLSAAHVTVDVSSGTAYWGYHKISGLFFDALVLDRTLLNRWLTGTISEIIQGG